MAEVYARSGDDTLIQITKEAMGHEAVKSTMIYFNISTETKRVIFQKCADELYGIKEKNK